MRQEVRQEGDKRVTRLGQEVDKRVTRGGQEGDKRETRGRQEGEKRDKKGGKKVRKKWEKDEKELEEYSFVKNKHTTLNVGQKKIVLGGPTVRESRKVFSKGDGSFSERLVSHLSTRKGCRQ